MKKYLGDRPDLARKLVQFRVLKAMLKYKVRAMLSPPPPPRAHAYTRSSDRCSRGAGSLPG